MMGSDAIKVLEKQHYKVVGNHSAAKLCLWTKKSIRGEGFCYKQKFYGIESHRCLQMTPAVSFCTHRCVFCWRNVEQTIGTELEKFDDPSNIIDGAIEAQRQLLSGFGGIPDRIDKRKLKESQNPNQASISLSGEPTIYPEIDQLIGEFKKRNFTTFLVTNGTFPERLANMENLPTQLYLSLVAPDEEIYKKVCNPIIPDAWERIKKTIDIFPSINTKKVIRITSVKGLNMTNPEKYAKLIEKANTDFLEVKAYMFLGSSRKRLTVDNMPSFEEIMKFSGELSREIGYKIKDFKEDSRVTLLSKV